LHIHTIRLVRVRRYGSIACFISDAPGMRDEYNDAPVATHPGAERRLREAGVDARLAAHVAQLFARDPLVVFEDRLDQARTRARARARACVRAHVRAGGGRFEDRLNQAWPERGVVAAAGARD
jgi:hypothetical protein